jgi:hypothetical protein
LLSGVNHGSSKSAMVAVEKYVDVHVLVRFRLLLKAYHV